MSTETNTLGAAVKAASIMCSAAYEQAENLRKARETLTGEELGMTQLEGYETLDEGPGFLIHQGQSPGSLDKLHVMLLESAQLLEQAAIHSRAILARLG